MKSIPVRKINTPSGSFPPENFNIRDLRDLLNGKDMIQNLHRHDFFYTLILRKGEGKHAIDFIEYPVCEYSVYFVRPGQVHQLALKRGSSGYLMRFNADFYSTVDKATIQLLRNAGSRNYYHFDSFRFKKIFSILTSIFQEYMGKQERYQETIKANLSIFFVELIRQHSEKISTNVNSYYQERLEEFLELLETHIANYKQVAEYADLLNLSPYQLNTITKSTLGKTCSEIINDYIILEAKRYLLATSDQVNHIAYHLGYEDVSYFIRFFKKHTGHTPDAFRHNFS